MNQKIPLLIDVLFIVIVLPALCLMLPIDRWVTNNFWFVCALICWLYIVYFLNRKFTIPLFFKGRKHVLLAIGILLATIFVTWLLSQYQMEFPQRMFHPNRVRRIGKSRLHQQAVWFLFTTASVFSIATGLFRELTRQIVRGHTLEYEKKKAELALYKAQINPHFLFNTLNTLYGMVVLKSEQTETAFIQFINLMKYMYTNPTKEMIPIEEEVEYIREFIEIQKYRTEKKELIHFSYTNDGAYPGLQIVPMLLITFIENALKYGLSSVHDGPVDIRIEVRNGILNFRTDNRKASEPHNRPKGIGIANCRKRLELAYPERHTLEIKETEHEFKVLLTIKLIEP